MQRHGSKGLHETLGFVWKDTQSEFWDIAPCQRQGLSLFPPLATVGGRSVPFLEKLIRLLAVVSHSSGFFNAVEGQKKMTRRSGCPAAGNRGVFKEAVGTVMEQLAALGLVESEVVFGGKPRPESSNDGMVLRREEGILQDRVPSVLLQVLCS